MDPLPTAAFPRLLADLWREQGWQTDTTRRGDDAYLVGGERGGGTRGLMLVLPDPDTEVRTAHLRRFAEMCGSRGVDVAVVATQGTFTDEVRRIASDRGVHLLDRGRLEKTVQQGGFEAVLRRHRDGGETEGADESGAEDDEDRADGGDWLARLRAALPGAADGAATAALRARAASNPKHLLAVVVAVAVLTSGVVIGVPTGGGGGPDIAVSAVSTATPEASESLTVRWRAETRSTLDPPGGTFEAPPNETFVLVRLDVSSTAGEAAMFGGPTLLFESDGVRYGPQSLSGGNLKTMDRFAPGDAGTVWAVFTVPTNATTGTVLVRDGLAADGPGVRFVHDPSLTVEFDAPSSESGSSSGTESESESESALESETSAAESASASLDALRAAVSAVDLRPPLPAAGVGATVAQ